MKLRSELFLSVLTLFVSVAGLAQEYTFKVKTDRPDAIYKKGENITFFAGVLADGRAVSGKNVQYAVTGDGNLRTNGVFISTEKLYPVTVKLDFPGWVRIKYTLLKDDGTLEKILNARQKEVALVGEIGAMVDPLEIKAAGEEPQDFDAFWQAARKELDAVPLKAVMVPVELGPVRREKVACYDVKVDCAGGMPVSGYLAKPVGAKPKSLPAIVTFQGAGVSTAPRPLHEAEMGAIALSVNAHGIDNGKPVEFYRHLSTNELYRYPYKDMDNRDKFYFRGMYMRAMRALDYIKSLPEWDGENLVVKGGSQGGGQSIAAAGLDPQVTLCIAGVPALSEHSGPLAKPPRQAGWPRLYGVDANGRPNNEAVCKTAAYFDNIYFAKRIKAECYFSTGFLDTSCAPTGVFAAYNNLPTTIIKEMTTTPSVGHGAPNTKGHARLNRLFDELKAK
ncbi:MAG: acetylxylan esterase [Kiritimatiellia bacterium]